MYQTIDKSLSYHAVKKIQKIKNKQNSCQNTFKTAASIHFADQEIFLRDPHFGIRRRCRFVSVHCDISDVWPRWEQDDVEGGRRSGLW
jgi:hypothetical protein